MYGHDAEKPRPSLSQSTVVLCILENKKSFELNKEGYRDGIKRKETR